MQDFVTKNIDYKENKLHLTLELFGTLVTITFVLPLEVIKKIIQSSGAG